MRDRDSRGKLVGSVQTGTSSHLSPLRCTIQKASHRVTWSVGNGTMKLRTKTHAVRVVEPIRCTDPVYRMKPRKPRKGGPRVRLVKAV